MTLSKRELYGTFMESRERRERLADMATRKALDLPLDDDVNITNTTTHNGLPWAQLALLVGGTLAGGTGLGLALPALLGSLERGAPPPEIRPANPSPQFSQTAEPQEYRVTFWAEDGKPIDVQREGK